MSYYFLDTQYVDTGASSWASLPPFLPTQRVN